VRPRAVGWTLALSGRAEMLFVWKNAMNILRATTASTALRYVAPVVGISVGATSALMAATQATGAAAVAGTLALAVAAFAIVLAPQFTVHNAAAILFPAWVPLGAQRPRGLDAMGQRLIMFFGILLALVVMLLPGIIPAGVVWLVFHRVLGSAVLVPAAAVLTA